MDNCRPDPSLNQPQRIGPGTYAKQSQGVDDEAAIRELRETADPIAQELVDLRSRAYNRRVNAPKVTQPSVEPSKSANWLIGPYNPDLDQKTATGPDGGSVGVDALSNGPSEPGSKARIVLDELSQPIGILPLPKGIEDSEPEEEEFTELPVIGNVKVFYIKFERFRNGERVRALAHYIYLPLFDSFRVSVWVAGDRPEPQEIWFYDIPENRPDSFLCPKEIQVDNTGTGLDDWVIYCLHEAVYIVPGDSNTTGKYILEVKNGPNKSSQIDLIDWQLNHTQTPYDTLAYQGFVGNYIEFKYKGFGLIEVYKPSFWIGTYDDQSLIYTSVLGNTVDFGQELNPGNAVDLSFSEPRGKIGLIVNNQLTETDIGIATTESSAGEDSFTSNLSGRGITITTMVYDNPSQEWYSVNQASDITEAKKPILPGKYRDEKFTGSLSGNYESYPSQILNYVQWAVILVSPNRRQALVKKRTLESNFNGSISTDNLKVEWFLYDLDSDSYTLLQTVSGTQVSNSPFGGGIGNPGGFEVYSQSVTQSQPFAMFEVGSEGFWVDPDAGEINGKLSSLISRFDDLEGYPVSEGNKYLEPDGETMFDAIYDFYHPNNYLPLLHNSKLYYLKRPSDITWAELYDNGGKVVIEVYPLPLPGDLEPEESFEYQLQPIRLEGLLRDQLVNNPDKLFLHIFKGHRFILQ